MKIERIDITEMDNISVLADENVYAVFADRWSEGYKMVPIKKCEIQQLLNGELSLIRIVK